MANRNGKDTSTLSEIQKVLLDDKEFLRDMLEQSIQEILNSEFSDYIGALSYERTDNRKGYRNGSYTRTLNTRVGRLNLRVLRDRDGNFRTELFKRYQRSEKALILTMSEMYIQGVSTRKVSQIVEKLCGVEISAGQVSQLSKELDENIKKWRTRPLKKKYPYLMIDARYESVREDGAVSSKAAIVSLGIDEDGKREILSTDMGDSESYEVWKGVFNDLKDRGLHGLSYVVSDDNKGLVKALQQSFQGVSWQRCQVHFMRNFKSKLKRKDQKEYMGYLKDIFNAPDEELARERKNNLVEKLEKINKKASEWLDEEIEYTFSVYKLPKSHRKRMRSTNLIERFNQEILRRTRVVRIFPNEESCLRLVSALCMEKSELWQTGVRYLNMEDIEEEAVETDKKSQIETEYSAEPLAEVV